MAPIKWNPEVGQPLGLLILQFNYVINKPGSFRLSIQPSTKKTAPQGEFFTWKYGGFW